MNKRGKASPEYVPLRVSRPEPTEPEPGDKGQTATSRRPSIRTRPEIPAQRQDDAQARQEPGQSSLGGPPHLRQERDLEQDDRLWQANPHRGPEQRKRDAGDRV